MSFVSDVSSRARDLVLQGQGSLDSAIDQALEQALQTNPKAHHGQTAILGEQVRARLIGFGALEPLLRNPDIEEIWINGPDQIFFADQFGTHIHQIPLPEEEIRQLVERMLRDSGRRIDRSEPFVDATLADGSRLHVVIPDVTKSFWAVNIRKFPQRLLTLEDLVRLGTLSSGLASFLSDAFAEGKNILISGATQAGKTTFLSALLDLGHKTERLITVEETFEIKTRYQDVVSLQARQANLEGVGEITLRRLVREALRMRPTRLVIGEVRQAEALDLLIALNSGISGMCTIHANSAFEALEKLKLLPLLAGENIPAQFVQESVDRTIDMVIHCEAKPVRRVASVIQANRLTPSTRWEELQLA